MLAQEMRMPPRQPLQTLTNKKLRRSEEPAKSSLLQELPKSVEELSLTTSALVEMPCEECIADKERALTLEAAILDVVSQNNLLEREVEGLEVYLEDLIEGLKERRKQVTSLKKELKYLTQDTENN